MSNTTDRTPEAPADTSARGGVGLSSDDLLSFNIAEIREEIGEDYEYSAHYNGNSILMTHLKHKPSGFKSMSNRAHFGLSMMDDAMEMKKHLKDVRSR